MAKLSENTVVISDGDIKLYKRRNSSVWQAKFKIDNRWVRISTERRKLDEAKVQAKEQIVEFKIKQRHQIPVVTKTFGSVAKLAISEMQNELQRGGGTNPSYLQRGESQPEYGLCSHLNFTARSQHTECRYKQRKLLRSRGLSEKDFQSFLRLSRDRYREHLRHKAHLQTQLTD